MARRSKTVDKNSKAKARQASPRKGRKTVGTKRQIAPVAKPLKGGSVSGLAEEMNELRAQTAATSGVLKAISRSSFDLQTVLSTLVEVAARLCEADRASINRPEGDVFRQLASYGYSKEYQDFMGRDQSLRGRGTLVGRTLLEGKTVHIPDVLADPDYTFFGAQKIATFRTMLGVPLMREGIPIGVLGLTRLAARPFNQRQIDLVETFADQAVIAIENARLFNETKAALERQTATAEILKVIASSPANLQLVFDTIAERANRLIGGHSTAVVRFNGDMVELAAFTPMNPQADDVLRASFPVPQNQFNSFLTRTGDVLQLADSEAENVPVRSRDLARARGFRSVLSAPLIGDRGAIGAINVARKEPGGFPEHHIQLLRMFADQAVIAIRNARLFEEVRAKTRDLEEALQQQTATADVLKVISRSTFDLQTVLETLIKSAVNLSGANRGSIFLREGDVFPLKAASSTTHEFLQYWAANPPKAGRGSATSRVIGSGKVEIIPDVLEDPEMEMPTNSLFRIRAALGVPMLRDNKVEGVLVLTRPEPGPFTKSQIDLVQTFADQAVIAVENVRLFEETKARTKELAASLEDLRAAQDRLVQTEKLASLGQLTAGIAHEIKNPLNFVNNFSSLSAELVAEMSDVLEKTSLDMAAREELDGLAEMLKSNLEKVVQHGKRADSIVKNMLQHSREGSSEHRAVDINTIVDESLNLAYHGARAEKAGFSIALQRDLDPSAGMADVYPQEITRVLLNIISNGFYAATKQKAEAGDGFEPTLAAVTKNLGDKVEIRIRDNGTGIPEEVKGKIFNPFFTTKPTGEGTGLGLSMSHDIIVKQHGGSIDVDTEPGFFTEFKIVLPRTSQR